MLYKKELTEVPVPPCPDVEVTKKKGVYGSSKDWAVAAQVLELKKSGRVLVADYYLLPDQEPQFRFACDGTNYLTAEQPLETWTQKKIESHVGYCSVHEPPSTKEAVGDFFHSNLNYHTATREMDDFCSRKNMEKRWAASDGKEEMRKRHFSMYPALPDNLAEYCNRHIFNKSYVFLRKTTEGQRKRCPLQSLRKAFPGIPGGQA